MKSHIIRYIVGKDYQLGGMTFRCIARRPAETKSNCTGELVTFKHEYLTFSTPVYVGILDNVEHVLYFPHFTVTL